MHNAPEESMVEPRVLARRLRRRAWLAGWRLKDGLAEVHRRVPEGTVALTFDDGPHPDSTPRVLDRLAELGVPATFFCVGRNAQAHPELVARALAEGHAVGSHSFSHPHPAETSLARLGDEYRRGRQALADSAGWNTPLFRPPHGHLGFRSAVMVRTQRLSPWLWTVDPQDWRPGITTREVAEVASTARSGDVVLLHDWAEQPWAPESLDRSATIDALPAIVEAVQARGLRFTTLPSR
jgi:peptidoglycan/xylan/chitin deacetylase (PgdA/CDA1 family)